METQVKIALALALSMSAPDVTEDGASARRYPMTPQMKKEWDIALVRLQKRAPVCGIAGCDCGCREGEECCCASKAARQIIRQPPLMMMRGGWQGGGAACSGGG